MNFTTTSDELRTALARFESEATFGVVNAKNYRCRYVTWGTGRPLFIVHGLSDIPRSFAMLMCHLSKRFQCIAIELASGDQDHCRYRSYRHHHHIEDLKAIQDRFGFESIDLLGSSFGSTVTLRFCVLHPHRVQRLILQGGFAKRPIKRIERGLARLARYWPGMMSDLVMRPRIMKHMDEPQFSMAAPEIYRFFLQCSGAQPIQATARRGLMLHTVDLRPLLHIITQPTLMIGGDRDGLVPRWCEAEVESRLPNVRRIEISVCGHYPQYTHPRIMAEAIESFLN